ncbi:MAG: hypothetical protein R2698_08955 [Microthrixaceae bacterium]
MTDWLATHYGEAVATSRMLHRLRWELNGAMTAAQSTSAGGSVAVGFLVKYANTNGDFQLPLEHFVAWALADKDATPLAPRLKAVAEALVAVDCYIEEREEATGLESLRLRYVTYRDSQPISTLIALLKEACRLLDGLIDDLIVERLGVTPAAP